MFSRQFRAALLLIVCSGPPLFAQDANVELAMNAREALRQNCWRCHNGVNSMGGDFDMLDPKSLVENGVIDPANPDSSLILQRIANESMPPFEVRQIAPVTVGHAEAIRAWIKAGAPPFPAHEGREFIYLEKVLTAVRDYLRFRTREDRSYLRFFTIHHLHNNPRYTDADLRIYRAALSKTLNSLNWNVRPVLPLPIDMSDAFGAEQHGFLFQTVFVIDLRDYIAADARGWDRTRYWDDVTRVYPYGLSYNDAREPRLKRLDADLYELTTTPLYMLRADWFVSTATRPPLYHKLLGIPEYAYELEAKLGVDIAQNFLKPTTDRIARSGFPKSGISNQNRLVERHGSNYGAYWKSYDFLPQTKNGNLIRYPVGPLTLYDNPAVKRAFSEIDLEVLQGRAFEHDGGEIIFNLPNGLQGYMLTDGHDKRIDAGPIPVVADPLKTSGNPLIVDGLSCMACHKHGMIDMRDTIRENHAVYGLPADVVSKIYPEQRYMDRLVEDDRRRFLNTLEVVIGPFLRTGPDDRRPITEFLEPVGEVARTHYMVYLDLETVACELDVPTADILKARVGEAGFKELGLYNLLNGGVIARNAWEATDGISSMQELARVVGFTPVR